MFKCKCSRPVEWADYNNEAREFIPAYQRENKMDMQYALLPWTQFHKLDASARVQFFATRGQAWEAAEASDEILPVASSLRQGLADAFECLARSAWTPNQAPDERDASAAIEKAAESLLATYRQIAGAECRV